MNRLRPASNKVTYWTADEAGQRAIKKWLKSVLEDDALTFYASFINWCTQQVTKFKHPLAKYNTNADRERAANIMPMLREKPLNIRSFVGLMNDYLEREWRRGVKRGNIINPEAQGKLNPLNFSLKLSITANVLYRRLGSQVRPRQAQEAVWTKEERHAMLLAEGKPLPEREICKQRKKKRNRARYEAELKKQRVWGLRDREEGEEMEDEAEEEAEEEVEEPEVRQGQQDVDTRRATKAMGQLDIVRKLWGGELVVKKK